MRPLVLATLLAACDGGKLTLGGVTCGAGTHLEGDVCLPDGSDTDLAGTDTDPRSDTDTSGDTDVDTDPGPVDVCDDGVAPYTTLQDAVDAASDGDTILVCPGAWGPVEITAKALTLRAVGGRNATTIGGTTLHAAVLVDTADVVLEGFALTGRVGMEGGVSALSADGSRVAFRHGRIRGVSGGSNQGYLILSNRSDLVLDDLVVEDNHLAGPMIEQVDGTFSMKHTVWRSNGPDAGFAPMIANLARPDVVLANNVFYDNVLGGGFSLQREDAVTVVANNVFYGNQYEGESVSRVLLQVQGDKVVRNNVFAANVGFQAVSVVNASHPSGTQYNLTDENEGSLDYSFNPAGLHALRGDPMFVDPAHGDFRLAPGSPAIDAGDPATVFEDVDGSRNDLGAYGGAAGRW